MVISFDLDDVLASFQLGWIEFNKQKYNEHYKFEDFYVFDYNTVMNLENDETFKRIFEFYESDVFKKLEPFPGALPVVTELAKTNDLYVITSRSPEIKAQTEAWIEQYYPGLFKGVLLTGQISRQGFDHRVSKADICKEYHVDYHIDDAPLHVEGLLAIGTKVIILEKPWNRTFDFKQLPIIRLKDIAELPQILQK